MPVKYFLHRELRKGFWSDGWGQQCRKWMGGRKQQLERWVENSREVQKGADEGCGVRVRRNVTLKRRVGRRTSTR